ncbi:hypothetical protein I547_5871 [Mycobacterium kansasii 824]|uniref:Uncharacterized protein n=1 Tax=Mycobacterium kansasii TaxID=1768 RepID=A0A1V3WV74_MYCKA|nr:hypothetical protein I547_5871 [Mycobacterium kansasii 824]KEP39492.1 hypothetical protein MKSMC1_53640 [Mycobacterium kansasii]OOK70830.1 hypothetical protein BZL30_6071 [Mycobacterium kansasii]
MCAQPKLRVQTSVTGSRVASGRLFIAQQITERDDACGGRVDTGS